MKQQNENQNQKPWDELSFIMDFEGGDLSDERLVEGFQHLVDNGHAWSLQGMYGRMAMQLIHRGLIHPPKHMVH